MAAWRARFFAAADIASGNGNFATHNSWHVTCFANWHTARNAACLRDHLGLTHLMAGRIRDAFGQSLLNHAAGCVRNLTADAVSFHGAGCVRNLFGAAFCYPCASRVWDLLGSCFSLNGTGCVRNLLGSSFSNKRASCAWYFASGGVRHTSARCVRNSLVANFWYHASAGDLLLHNTRNPTLAADCLTRARTADDLCATWVARIWDTFLDHRPRNSLGVSFPTSTVHRNSFGCRDRLHDGVARVTVACLSFHAVGRVALVTVSRLISGPANGVALSAVACFEDRLADGVANILVTCFVDRFFYGVVHRLPSGVHNRLANFVLHGAIVCFVHRTTHRVVFVSVVCCVNIPRVRHRNFFCTAVEHHSHCGVLLLIPHNVSHSAILDAAATLCRSKVATRIASFGATT